MSCDVSEAELIVIVIAELILQPFRHFTYITVHSPSLPSLYLRHSSFSNPSVTSPTSQLILQDFRRFTHVTVHSPTLPLLHLRHSSFLYHSFAFPTPRALHLRHLASRPWSETQLQICCNPECRAECGVQFCDILRLPLLTHVQSIGDQHPTGKQGVELCCSPRGVVLYGGCPERHPCLPGTLYALVSLFDMATLHRHMLHAVPENIIVYCDLVPLQF